jgi:hypothetical protein
MNSGPTCEYRSAAPLLALGPTVSIARQLPHQLWAHATSSVVTLHGIHWPILVHHYNDPEQRMGPFEVIGKGILGPPVSIARQPLC